MSEHTTFCIGGPADAYLVVRDARTLGRVYRFAAKRRVPVFVLGWGSNLLVRDGGLRAVVVRLRGDFEKIRFLRGLRLWAGAGVRLPKLVMSCAARAMSGAEPLVGVPGTVGGGLVMNAGTRDGEIGDLVVSVDTLDVKTSKIVRLPRSSIRFSYRKSSLQKHVVLGGTLQLRPGSKVDIIETVKECQRKRQKTQPIHTYNVGSVFKNPPGHFVAKLIQDAGLKGKAVRGAKISSLHANFIENFNKAKAADVLRLVDRVKNAVKEKYGIDLELEMKVVGEEAPRPA